MRYCDFSDCLTVAVPVHSPALPLKIPPTDGQRLDLHDGHEQQDLHDDHELPGDGGDVVAASAAAPCLHWCPDLSGRSLG